MKTNLKIESMANKVSAKGRPYKSFTTNEGIMSCFDLKALPQLEANIGKIVEVEVEERNGFKNITGFYAVGAQTAILQTATSPVSKPFEAGNSRQASVVISYVKDMVCAGKVEVKDMEVIALRLMGLHTSLSK